MPNILIDLAAEFTGKKAFDKAGSSTAKLEKGVKSLSKTFGVAFSTAAVLAYGKASVKAAAADIKAQQQLALALKNVGLERDAATAEGYIQRIEKEFGVIDDKLRPAYASLTVATRDTAETQRILGIALNISASTGKDLNSVVAALSKAYLGNNTSLAKLGVGISKADLKTKSFKEITDQLAVTFAGAAKSSADSFSGSMDKLAIASNNAKEIIGTSLIGALQSLGKDDSMATLSSNIESAASSLANFIDSVVYLKEQLNSLPGMGITKYFRNLFGDVIGFYSPQHLAELIKQLKGFQGMGNVAMTGGSNQDTQRADLAAKKAAAAKIKAAKAAADAKIKLDKAAAAKDLQLKQAAAAFDITKIGIAAALKNTYDKDERLRLLALQAIENDNGEAALKYIEQLAILTKAQQTDKLNGIKGITENELSSINTILLKDLEAIRTSKMSEEDRAKARQEAWNKYNAAISASGGLAESQFYSEKLQAQNLAVAKIAALDTVSAAQTALLTLAKVDELDVIKIIQTAQKTADDAKYKALQDYIALIKSVPQVLTITQTPIGNNEKPILSDYNGSNAADLAASASQAADAAAAAAAQATAEALASQSITDKIAAAALNSGFTAGGSSSMFNPHATTPGSSAGWAIQAQPITINVITEGNIIGVDQFDDVINQAFLNAQRKGLSQSVAGSLPGAG